MKTNVKAKNGKSFPDLNKDGKVTRADILKGRGVIAKKGATVKKAQTGKIVKKTKTSKQPMNTLVPAMGIPTSAPKKVETMNAKVGKSVKKYQMGGFVSNEFASKSQKFPASPKPTSNTKLLDSSIKKGKAINAYQGKKGMVAKSGTIVKKAQRGTKLKLSERYSKTADSLWSESNRKMKEAGKVTVDSKERRWKQKSDSLVKSADKDFKGGLQARQKEFELRKKGMRTGGSMKKCRYGCK